MTEHELSMEHSESPAPRRVVEAELKLPKLSEIKLPQVDLAPARAVAEQVLITGIGVGVLLARGVIAAVRAANAAGAEAASHPGPVTKALLSLVRPEGPTAAMGQLRVHVPVLPIDHYELRSVAEILNALPGLSAEQLRVVREYELEHQARPEVIAALNNRLTTA